MQFYNSKLWRSCRKEYVGKRLLADGGMCERCREEPGEEVHHKEHLTIKNIDDVNITVNHDNLEYLCRDCHFREHSEQIVRRPYIKPAYTGYYFDEGGRVKPIECFVVYGAPASGKSLYVREQMAIGDLVVDVDLIKEALTLSVRGEYVENLTDVAIRVRDFLYGLIEKREVITKRIWVVATLPKKKEREALAHRLNAELIYIDATYKECIERATADNSRLDKALQCDIIRKWFEEYEA